MYNFYICKTARQTHHELDGLLKKTVLYVIFYWNVFYLSVSS